MSQDPENDIATEITVRTWMGEPIEPNQSMRKLDDSSLARFLKHYAQHGRKGHACQAAGVSYHTFQRNLMEDKRVAALVEEARQIHLSNLEAAAYERAVDGVEQDIFDKDGNVIGTKVVYSDKLLELLLKKADPNGYGNGDGTNINVNVKTGVMVAPAGTTIENTPLKIEDVE